MNGVEQIPIPASRAHAGVAYVMIPEDVDREDFVARCYRTNTVCIYTEQSEFILDVLIHPNILQYVEFPLQPNQLGSMISWVNISNHNKPLVVGLCPKNDDATGLMEHYFQLSKDTDKAISRITGRGNVGTLDFLVKGDEKDTGRINFKVINSQGQGKYQLEVDGDVNITADNKITLDSGDSVELIVSDPEQANETKITYKAGQGFSYKDEYDNEWIINSNGVEVRTNKFVLGNGSDSAVLYNKLVRELGKVERKADACINAIRTAPVAILDGGATFKASMIGIIEGFIIEPVDYLAFKSNKMTLD